jgi:IclR family acetate operon transcriptional repressor
VSSQPTSGLLLHSAERGRHDQAVRTGERNTFDSVIGRAAAVLGAFDARHLSLGVSELSRRSGLATHGFLERTDGSDFKLGTKLFEWGELASRQRKLREVALPYMADLRQVSRQTVHLAVLVGTEVMYVEIVRSRDAPRMPSEVGGRLPAHAAGVGKAMLAFSPDDVVAAVIERGLPAVGPRTITAPGLLLRELRRIRESGIAYESEESGYGVGCAASPILSADGLPVAAMSISGWNGKLDLRRIGPAVKTAALALSRDLQLRGPAAAPSWAQLR